MTPDPRTLYKQRLEERRAAIAQREQRHRMLGRGKLAMAACGVALVWLALAQGAFSILWVLIPIAGFALLVVVHEKLLKELERRRRAARFFEKALARLDGNWAGTGEPGDRYNDGRASVCAGSGPVRQGQRVRTAVHGAHADRRGPAGAVVEIARRCPKTVRARQAGRGRTARSAWICARIWRSSPKRRAPAWTRCTWRLGRSAGGAAAGRFPHAGPPAHRCWASPALRRSGFT